MVLVTVFSNPMVDALTSLADPNNNDLLNGSKRGQHIPIPGIRVRFFVSCRLSILFPFLIVFYISFIVTPICSNASEIVSSLIFASKKKKVTSSMTFSQVKFVCLSLVYFVWVNQRSGKHFQMKWL